MKLILPKYQYLVQTLRQEIVTGKLPAGGQLPTEGVLAKQYGFSRETVRKALSRLEREGLIRREQGVGSFVNELHPDAAAFRFLEAATRPEKKEAYRVIRQDVMPATMEHAESLKIALGSLVIHVAQVKTIKGVPVAYTERLLPLALCPNLAQEDLTTWSVHEILSESVKHPPTRTVVEIEARALSAEEAQWLECPLGTPAIIVDRTSYTAPNQPAVMYRGIFKDRYSMEVELDAQSTSKGKRKI
jgi:GntR family transcriptional regulator